MMMFAFQPDILKLTSAESSHVITYTTSRWTNIYAYLRLKLAPKNNSIVIWLPWKEFRFILGNLLYYSEKYKLVITHVNSS